MRARARLIAPVAGLILLPLAGAAASEERSRVVRSGPAAVASPSTAEPAVPLGPAAASCAVARIASPDLEEAPRRSRRFSASRTIGLEFDVLAAATPGDHRLELRLFTPQGHLYQALPATFAAEPPVPGSHRRRDDGSRSRVRVRLSIPGSPIVTHSLFGRWEARPHLDGAGEPCGTAARFWIER